MDNNELQPVAVPEAHWPAPPPPSKPATGIFSGRFGLRAGWGILLFIVIFAVGNVALTVPYRMAQGKSAFPKKRPAAQTATTAPAPAPASSQNINVKQTLPGEGLGTLAVLFAGWVMSKIEGRRFRVFGVGKNRLRDFLPGAFWGLAMLSLLVGVLRATHVLVFDERVLTGGSILAFGAKWMITFALVGVLEESLTRGYLQYTLTRGLYGMGEKIYPKNPRAVAFWSAAVIMSCVFGAGHLGNTGESAAGITMVFLAGMVFSYALWWTGSLWWAIGFHMAWDWAQSFLYGVPDSGGLSGGRLFNTHPTGNPLLSGGATGPEGSVFVLPTMLLVILVVRLTTKPGPQPELEPLTVVRGLPPENDVVIA